MGCSGHRREIVARKQRGGESDAQAHMSAVFDRLLHNAIESLYATRPAMFNEDWLILLPRKTELRPLPGDSIWICGASRNSQAFRAQQCRGSSTDRPPPILGGGGNDSHNFKNATVSSEKCKRSDCRRQSVPCMKELRGRSELLRNR